VEIKILKELFSEEHARMFMNLSFKSESPKSIAARLNQEPDKVSELLEVMSDKGLIFRKRKGEQFIYRIAPFVVGIYEYQLKRMDKELAQLFEQYHEEIWLEETGKYPTGFHTIPVGESIDTSWRIAPYDITREFLRSQEKICVTDCVCRVQKKILGKGCGHPLEVCLYFGSHAEYIVDKHGGRWITQEEALKIQAVCEKQGLVTQVDSTENPAALCHCCDCCCGILRALKMHPRPAQQVVSNFYSEVDLDLCSCCEVCIEHCPMAAIDLDDEGFAFVNRDRCIGCGVCIPSCPSDAIILRQKPKAQRQEVPLKKIDLAMKMAELRGKV